MIDTSNNGSISRNEFKTALIKHAHREGKKPMDSCLVDAIFKDVDTNSGLSKKSFCDFIHHDGEDVQDIPCDCVFDVVDKNKSGKINFPEFKKAIKK